MAIDAAPADAAHVAATRPLAPPVAGAGATPGDRPLDAGSALRLVLATQARVRPEQLDDDEPLDELFQGASSRRNQVLLDLAREFGLSGGEGVAQQPVGELVRALREQGAHYRFPGPYLRDSVAAGLTRALGRSGLSRADAAAHLAGAWGLGPGLADHVLALLALETRPGPSARGGPLGRLAEQAATTTTARPAASSSIARRRWPARRSASRSRRPRRATPRRRPPRPIRTPSPPPSRTSRRRSPARPARCSPASVATCPAPAPPQSAQDPERERLAQLDAELGAGRAQEVAPRFDHRRHVRFASAWASARWDLVAAYHDGLRGELDARDVAARRGARRRSRDRPHRRAISPAAARARSPMPCATSRPAAPRRRSRRGCARAWTAREAAARPRRPARSPSPPARTTCSRSCRRSCTTR